MTFDRDQVKTREEMKKMRTLEKEVQKMREGRKKIRVRLIPVWIKVTVVFILLFISVLTGTVVGYGVIGNGNPMEALQKSTWVHIMDLINRR